MQHVLSSFFATPTRGHPTTSSGPPANATALADLDKAGPQSLFSFLFGFSSSLGDWAKLGILGGIIELARRTASYLWAAFLSAFFITAHFDGEDDAYTWMMVWLSKQRSWKTAREVEVSTRNWTSSNRYYVPEEDIVIADDGDSNPKGRRLNLLPSFGTTHTLWFRHHILRVTRDRNQIGGGMDLRESLTISIFGRNHRILHDLLKDAQSLHKQEEKNRVAIYFADNYNNWRCSGSRPKRPLSSVILDQGIKEMLLEDATDFLGAEDWYAERGIPFRRGYLLHGAPGSGKTSLIHSIAGALNLDIYVISLSRKGMDDTALNELICELPARSIALMEDLDAAFVHGVGRSGMSPSSADSVASKPDDAAGPSQETTGGITLSGLLGAIDGVAAQEGRILFATTNRYHVLDPALIRPGRLDLHLEFQLASGWQAGEIFKSFFPAVDDVATEGASGSITGNPTEKRIPKAANGAPTSQDGAPQWKAARLTAQERDALATAFAAAIPDRVTSMASIQGHLMGYKTRPHAAVEKATLFIESEIAKSQTPPTSATAQGSPKAEEVKPAPSVEDPVVKSVDIPSA